MKIELVDDGRVLMVTGVRNASGLRNQQWLLRLEQGRVVARREKLSREALAAWLNVDSQLPRFRRLCDVWETAKSLADIKGVVD
jgi:hypothetical protein